MQGTIEILLPHMTYGQESIGIPFDVDSTAELPGLIAARGITNLTTAPLSVMPGRQPIKEWTGTASDGRKARIVAWEEVPFGETAIGRALASGDIPPHIDVG